MTRAGNCTTLNENWVGSMNEGRQTTGNRACGEKIIEMIENRGEIVENDARTPSLDRFSKPNYSTTRRIPTLRYTFLESSRREGPKSTIVSTAVSLRAGEKLGFDYRSRGCNIFSNLNYPTEHRSWGHEDPDNRSQK